MMKYQEELIDILKSDRQIMTLLAQVRSLRLPDCWIAAGLIRNRVWDLLYAPVRRDPESWASDVDIIWFDPDHAQPEVDLAHEERLHTMDASMNWSVKNQARMHTANGDRPYVSAFDAMCFWPETATAVGVRLNPVSELEVAAPYGLQDLFEGLVRPTPTFIGTKFSIIEARVREKAWVRRWPGIVMANVETNSD